MARIVRTRRRRPRRRATPQEIMRAYTTYVPCHGDNLGEFLASFHRHWLAAAPHGASGRDGVIRLIRLLPADWKGWATMISGDYVYTVPPLEDTYIDFLGFLSMIQFYFTLYGSAPFGPYIRPGDYVMVGNREDRFGPPIDPGQPLDYHLPHPTTPASPPPSPHAARDRRPPGDDEAGPSRVVRARRETHSPEPHSFQTLTPLTTIIPTADAEYAAAVAEAEGFLAGFSAGPDRGKAPVEESDSAKYGGVGTCTLEPIPPPLPETWAQTARICTGSDPTRLQVDEMFRSVCLALETDEGRGESRVADADPGEDPNDLYYLGDSEENPEEDPQDLGSRTSGV